MGSRKTQTLKLDNPGVSFTMQPSRTDHHDGVPPEVYDHRIQARTPQQPKHGSRGSVRNLAGIKHALLVGVANQERAFLFRCVLRVDDAVVGQYPLLIEGSYRDDQGQSANYVVEGMEEDGNF